MHVSAAGSFFETEGAEKAIIMSQTSETNSDTHPVGVTSRHTPSICSVCKKRPSAFNLKVNHFHRPKLCRHFKNIFEECVFSRSLTNSFFAVLWT